MTDPSPRSDGRETVQGQKSSPREATRRPIPMFSIEAISPGWPRPSTSHSVQGGGVSSLASRSAVVMGPSSSISVALFFTLPTALFTGVQNTVEGGGEDALVTPSSTRPTRPAMKWAARCTTLMRQDTDRAGEQRCGDEMTLGVDMIILLCAAGLVTLVTLAMTQ